MTTTVTYTRISPWDQILELGFPAEARRVELDPEAGVFMAYGRGRR